MKKKDIVKALHTLPCKHIDIRSRYLTCEEFFGNVVLEYRKCARFSNYKGFGLVVLKSNTSENCEEYLPILFNAMRNIDIVGFDEKNKFGLLVFNISKKKKLNRFIKRIRKEIFSKTGNEVNVLIHMTIDKNVPLEKLLALSEFI
jgi:hypothetical protein